MFPRAHIFPAVTVTNISVTSDVTYNVLLLVYGHEELNSNSNLQTAAFMVVAVVT